MSRLQMGRPATFGSMAGSGVGFSNAQMVTPGLPGGAWDAQARGLAAIRQPAPMSYSPLWGGFASMLAGRPMGGGGGRGASKRMPYMPRQQAPGAAQSAMPPGIAPVTTTIDAGRDIYNKDFVQRAVNQSAADAYTTADPRYQMERFTRPGLSQDAGTMSAALPGIAQSLAQASQAQGALPLQAELANRQYRLQGETARAGEANQLARLMAQLQGNRDFERTSLAAPLLNPLFQLLMG